VIHSYDYVTFMRSRGARNANGAGERACDSGEWSVARKVDAEVSSPAPHNIHRRPTRRRCKAGSICTRSCRYSKPVKDDTSRVEHNRLTLPRVRTATENGGA